MLQRFSKRLQNLRPMLISGGTLSRTAAVLEALAVAAALEELGIRDIIGCIAGDNTIMCATKSPENAEQVKIQLEKMLNGR